MFGASCRKKIDTASNSSISNISNFFDVDQLPKYDFVCDFDLIEYTQSCEVSLN